MPRKRFKLHAPAKENNKIKYERVNPCVVKINGIVFMSIVESDFAQAGVNIIYPDKGRTRHFIPNSHYENY